MFAEVRNTWDQRNLRLSTLACLFAAACLVSGFWSHTAFAQGVAACDAFPAADCRRPAKSKFLLKQTGGEKDKLIWKWVKGDATLPADFGSPTATTGYALCVYAGSHSALVAEPSIPADSAKWSATSKGFKYKDKGATADGIDKMTLGGGEQGKAKILVKGKGDSLPDPALPASLPLRVQLINSETGICWEDTYDGSDVSKNETDPGLSQLKVKGGAEDPNPVFAPIRARKPLPRKTALEAGVPAFVGASATTSPLAPLVLPDHPFLNNEGDSRIHNDAFNSAVYNRDGPRGVNMSITTAELLEPGDFSMIGAMLAFTEDGYAVGAFINAFTTPVLGGSTRLKMLDPVSLHVYADVEVAPRAPVQNAAGGAYFSLDQDGRFLIGPANNQVEVWALEVNGGTPAFVRLAVWDVSSDLPAEAMLQDTVVDWDGRLWFAAITGQVGYVDPATGAVEVFEVGEELQNSMAVDSTGVYVVTFDSMQKFSVDVNGSIVQDWRTPYDNTGPGLVQPGSGTTPTLFGSQNDLVGFADTALPQVNMVVLDRITGDQICLTPVFRPDESGAENTFIGYNDEVVVVNNGGFTGVFGPQNGVFPGLEKYTVRADRSGCDLVWANDTSFGNSAQLSTTTGLIYGWGPDPSATTLDAYYFTATDWITGNEVFRIYAGNDIPFNPVLGQIHLHPDGYAYLGSLQGVTRVADTP